MYYLIKNDREKEEWINSINHSTLQHITYVEVSSSCISNRNPLKGGKLEFSNKIFFYFKRNFLAWSSYVKTYNFRGVGRSQQPLSLYEKVSFVGFRSSQNSLLAMHFFSFKMRTVCFFIACTIKWHRTFPIYVLTMFSMCQRMLIVWKWNSWKYNIFVSISRIIGISPQLSHITWNNCFHIQLCMET